MTGDKFAFWENSLSLAAAVRGLLKSPCEKQRIAWRHGTEPSQRRRGRLGAGLRAAHAKI